MARFVSRSLMFTCLVVCHSGQLWIPTLLSRKCLATSWTGNTSSGLSLTPPRPYTILLEASDDKVSGEIFNAGYENVSVLDLAKLTKNVLGDDIKLTKISTDDNRSYHISSKKINEILNFVPKHTIKNAIEDLRYAFEKNLLPNSLQDEKYFNIKKMQKINLE